MCGCACVDVVRLYVWVCMCGCCEIVCVGVHVWMQWSGRGSVICNALLNCVVVSCIML